MLIPIIVIEPLQVFFAGHIPQVRIQVTVLEIIKQNCVRLLALILIQNVIFKWGQITWFTKLSIKQWPVHVTCRMWPVKEYRLSSHAEIPVAL